MVALLKNEFFIFTSTYDYPSRIYDYCLQDFIEIEKWVNGYLKEELICMI